MHLPWKKSKSKTCRISRFVSDLQQSPKRGGSLVVETGFPTSLIDLFVKNRNRLKKPPSSKKRSKDNNDKAQARLTAAPDNYHPPLRRLVSSPSPPSKPLRRGKLLPQKLDLASVTEKLTASKSEVSFSNRGGLTSEVRNDGEAKDGEIGGRCGGGGCFLMVVAIKVFVVAVLALSTKKLAVGVTLSAFALLFLELAVARVFTLLNLCPNAAQIRLHYLIVKLIGKKQREKIEESTTQERRNTVSFEIIEESMEETQAEEKISNFEDTSKLVKTKPLEEETVRDVVLTKEKSKSSKLKSKIVKKIVPKKLRSYKKKKKKMMKIKKEEDYVVEEEEEEEGYVTEVTSLISESEISEISSNPPLLDSCCCEEIQEEEEEGDYGSKGDITKVIVLIVIVLAGLLSGKVLAFVLTFSSCLILKVVCNKTQDKSLNVKRKKIQLL